MENVGELLLGKANHNFHELEKQLISLGYSVHAEVHNLAEYGLPQKRNRALIIAVNKDLALRTLGDLWSGFAILEEAKTVRRAISHLKPLEAGEQDSSDACHVSPRLSDRSLKRLAMIPKDGGSWPDILTHPEGWDYLIPSMERYARKGKVGPYRDVYGRLAWDEPAVTVKRECSHTGNGRYAHPEQNRHCTVRELAILQGFPSNYRFEAGSLSNMYRHIGDAVPPLISYQIAHLCYWIISGEKPKLQDLLLDFTHLKADDIYPLDDVSEFALAASN
jgi:DNA (cytosine-5)-methyltransferase 1